MNIRKRIMKKNGNFWMKIKWWCTRNVSKDYTRIVCTCSNKIGYLIGSEILETKNFL